MPGRALVLYPSEVDLRFEYRGRHIYDLLSSERAGQKNPCSFLGLASALEGTYLSWRDIRSYDDLRPFEVIVVVPRLEFRLDWLREAKRRYPRTVFVGQFEENVRKHKIWCRGWEFQKAFFEFAQLVDVMTTFNEQSCQYYELYARRPVTYLPHPYPVEYVQPLGLGQPPTTKRNMLLKAGHIHGRVGADGFADVAVLARILDSFPEFGIQIEGFPQTTEEVLAVFDIRQHQDARRLEWALLRGPLSTRLPAGLRRVARYLLYDPAPAGRPQDPLLLRRVSPERIQLVPRRPWWSMLDVWAGAYLALDMDTCFTVGRNAADAAATGTPIIGCNSDFQTKLYPELVVSELDYGKAEALARRLLDDGAWYESLTAAAARRLEQFSYANTRKRFWELVERVRPH